MNPRSVLLIGAGAALLVAVIIYTIVETRSLQARVFALHEREAELKAKLEKQVRANEQLREDFGKRGNDARIHPNALSIRLSSPYVIKTPVRDTRSLRDDRPGRAYLEQIRAQEAIMRRVQQPGRIEVDFNF